MGRRILRAGYSRPCARLPAVNFLVSSSSKTYFPALTGLRALAAFAVFGFHHRNAPIPSLALKAVLSELHIGVSIFFTLSGFLITHRYAGRRFDGPTWRRYLLHRVARIWPVYLLLVAATFAASYPTEGRLAISSQGILSLGLNADDTPRDVSL
ncbi:MAG: acyltransferase, partial [Cytophagaceae bacterium]